ncbi:MAG: S8 family serine peptidase [Gemmataceae bacterium]|nr:S8 family serine peptidase [Gemmataceae bacterium]
MLRRLLAHLRPQRTRRARPLATRRPWFERLEDRWAPSVTEPLAAMDPATVDPTHILVRLDPLAGDPRQLQILDDTAFTGSFALVPGLWEVELGAGVSVESALAAYQASPWIVEALPNYRLHLNANPNDPQFSSLWGLDNTGQTGGTADADIDAPAAWDVTTGSQSVIVAVIDTGVDYNHPDLAANIWTNAGEIAGDGIDNDLNGFVDDIHGYDFANDDADPMDDHSHGTHVSGTIGAVGNNGVGVSGVAWNVRIMALKFLDSSGNGTVADAIRALSYAVQMGAQISNNSYGGATPEDADLLFAEAIQNAAGFGHIFVAGAGNSGADNDAAGFFPASFETDNIISVAATDHNDQLAAFSNYGATSVDLAAPGVDILSTVPGGYNVLSGTSMATPHVAGVVALVRSLHPEWTYREVIDQILNSVDYLPGLDGRTVTAGRLNAARALLDNDGPRVVGTIPAGGVGGAVSTLRLFFNEPVDVDSIGLEDIASFTGPNGSIAVASLSVVPGSFDRKFDLTFAPQLAHGSYELTLAPTLTDRHGNAMDQDGDGNLGEALDDRFTAVFVIGDQYVFPSADTPKSLIPLSVTTSTLVVDEDLSIADLDVRININAFDVSYIGVALVSPGGARVQLAPLTGLGLGPEYRDTVFDDEALVPIGGGTSPFTGAYQPVEPLSILDGASALGTWRLEVLNLFGGTINAWALLLVANPPRISIDDVTVVEGDAGATDATFTVRLSNIVGVPVTVDFTTADGSTANGSASAGSDYDFTAGSVTFEPGEMTKTITVPVHGDTLDEADETFFVNLSNAANGAIVDAQGVGTILNDELAVSIDDVSVTEGNSGNTNAVFTVSLSEPSDHTVTVTYATAPGTATAATDYTTAGGTLTFAPGETSKPVTIIVKGDARYERAETFLVNLTAMGAFVIDGQGTGTILNDDPVPLVAVADVSLSEGNTGTKNLTFTVTLINASDDAVTVAYATADGTATAGSDYGAVSGTLTFAPGQTARNVVVVINGDGALEPSETFVLNLSDPVNAILKDSQAAGVILTDDLSLAIEDVTVAEGNDGAFAAVFTINLSAAAAFDVQVNFATANGTAAAGADYVAAGGALLFAAGETVKTIHIVGIADIRNEVDETFFVNLSAAGNAVLADSQGRATIVDDDPLPELSISDVAIVEGDSGTKNLTFTVFLSAPSGQSVTVQYSTAAGAAGAGDFQAATGTLGFGPGSLARSFNVVIAGDTAAEPHETFLVNLSGAVNAVIGDSQGVGTILDDDNLVVDDATFTEGDAGASVANFTVRLLTPSPDVVTVAYATANGTAVAGWDYLPAAGTLTFQPGETEQNVPVTVIGDGLAEAGETLFLNLSSPTGAGLADNKATATIANDDLVPTLSVSDAVIAEGNTGTRLAVFTLTLSHASGQGITVPFTTANGSATAGSDYHAKSSSVTIGAGATSATVAVSVIGDVAVEGNESFYLNLTAPANAILSDNQAVATIFDDEPLPVVSISDVTATEGHSGVKALSFWVTLSVPGAQTVTVQVDTADGAAGAGTDYVAKTEVVTFLPGQTAKIVTVNVNGDAVPEPTETFLVQLSAPSNAVLGDDQAVGTIQNDDSSLRVGDVTLNEADDGTTTALFTVTLTGPLTDDPVSVKYSTGNGSAAAGIDYIAASGVLVFPPGSTSQTVAVLVIGDRIHENNETFYLNLSGPVNAVIADSQGIATIIDAPDPLPSITIDDAAVVEGASGTRNLTFTARLSAPSGKVVTVHYATADGSAGAGSDYTAKTGVITFNPGITAVTVSVVVAGDTGAESDEVFYLNLSGAANAVLADSQAAGTIADDDCLVVDDVVVTEGDGAGVATFTVRLLVPRSGEVNVNYATVNGSAGAGIDYLYAAGTLSFAPGETIKTVDVAIVGDLRDEIDETFFLNLSNASGTILADSQGVATISDDDQPPSLSITDVVTVAEGNTGVKTITFTLRLSAPSGRAVTVQYATADGTATAGSDYVAKAGTITFSAGQTVATITITVNADLDVEGNESFFLHLSNPLNATLTATEALAFIVDDDSLP